EAHRILESHGCLYIVEPTKRWSEKEDGSMNTIIEGKEACKLVELLDTNKFNIINKKIDKFAMFMCMKE
ncbi:hypothetical protein ABK046_48805, partial [Streptomyces caeruleatus]